MQHEVQSLLDLPNTKWYSVPCTANTDTDILAFHWCLDHTSSGKFYFCICDWHFELESDALLFALRWGSV